MLNSFFNWLRKGAEAAILEGVGDAVEKLTGDEQTLPPRLAGLVAKLAPPPPALPAAAEPEAADKPARKRGADK